MVDDESDMRVLVRARLQEAGFQPVWEVGDGEAAIDIAYRHRPDVVILDYMMPGINGEAVAKALRILTPQSRILLFSAVLLDKPAWADDFLDKSELEVLASRAELLVSRPSDGDQGGPRTDG